MCFECTLRKFHNASSHDGGHEALFDMAGVVQEQFQQNWQFSVTMSYKAIRIRSDCSNGTIDKLSARSWTQRASGDGSWQQTTGRNVPGH
jgi:hypothetical protein